MLWRFGKEETHFWRQFIALKYEVDGGGWTMKPMRTTHWCSLWKSSRVGWERFVSHVPFEVEDGGHVRYCHDGNVGINL